MRERTTWNRNEIVKLANNLKKAEDPRAMNQDHLKQQPAADKYEIGGPSEFGEDIHPSNGTWKAEYSGGEVKRNEIGMPEMRGDTFNHSEKTAGQDEDEEDDFIEKKADVCLDIARKMLPKNASEKAIEDQAFAFMHMADADIVATAARLAAQQDEEEKPAQQEAKEAGQIPPQFLKDKKDDEDKGQQDKKEAGQIPPQFLKDKKDDEGDKKDDQGKEAQQQQGKDDEAKQAQGQQDKKDEEQQSKEAALNDLRKKACDALMQGDQAMAQQYVQQMAQQQAPVQQQLSQEQAELQVQQMLSQAQQGMPQQQVVLADDQLLDRMLSEQALASTDTSMLTASASAASMDIQLEGPSMDTTEVRLGSEDEALMALFASHDEVQQAAHAQSLQTGMPIQASAGMARTASTRTVGTRPTGGVAQLGGGVGSQPAGGGEIDKLAGLWASAPDVKSVFDT